MGTQWTSRVDFWFFFATTDIFIPGHFTRHLAEKRLSHMKCGISHPKAVKLTRVVLCIDSLTTLIEIAVSFVYVCGKLIVSSVQWRRRAKRTWPEGTHRRAISYCWTAAASSSLGVLRDEYFVDAVASESLDDGEHCYVHEELQELGDSEDGAAEPQTEEAANV